MSTSDGTTEPGESLACVLRAHQTFLRNVHSMLRLVEVEVPRRRSDLVLLRPGGYRMSRNGLSLSVASVADWTTTFVGIAFAPTDRVALVQARSQTALGSGIELIVFEVRWLEHAPTEPVAWSVKLNVLAAGQGPAKWEDAQLVVLGHLKGSAIAVGQGWYELKPGQAGRVAYTGKFLEVALSSLLTRDDVITRLIEPTVSDS